MGSDGSLAPVGVVDEVGVADAVEVVESSEPEPEPGSALASSALANTIHPTSTHPRTRMSGARLQRPFPHQKSSYVVARMDCTCIRVGDRS